MRQQNQLLHGMRCDQVLFLTVMQAHLNSIFSNYIQFNLVKQNFTEFQTLREALDVFAIVW